MTEAEYGEDWPFVAGVDEGTLSCERGSDIIFETEDGTRYLLNYNDRIDGEPQSDSYPSAEEIVAPNRIPSWAAQGLKAATGPLIDRALKLCPN
ncbi:DUF2511 domain-containing protein [Streptomyces sp. NPDC048514]|uniref:DUF2511 domain-containing protein n=1 Tax=Streptomyces sp. NPDC048514 TaxID=3365564 RepID=UPI0037232561